MAAISKHFSLSPDSAGCDQLFAVRAESRPSKSRTKAWSTSPTVVTSRRAELRLAIQTDPTYEKAYYNLGKVYQAQRKWTRRPSLRIAVQRSPDNANFHYDWVKAYLESKQLDRPRTHSRGDHA